jgi:L-rhamnose mutarotase
VTVKSSESMLPGNSSDHLSENPPRRHRLLRYRLRPDGIEEYRRLHRAIWPELLDAYRVAGITQIGCFMHGTELMVYQEVNPEIYDREKDSLSRSTVEIRWQSLMAGLREPDVTSIEYEEVFSLPPVSRNP